MMYYKQFNLVEILCHNFRTKKNLEWDYVILWQLLTVLSVLTTEIVTWSMSVRQKRWKKKQVKMNVSWVLILMHWFVSPCFCRNDADLDTVLSWASAFRVRCWSSLEFQTIFQVYVHVDRLLQRSSWNFP